MTIWTPQQLLIQCIDEYLEYKKTAAYYKRMKRRAINAKQIIKRLKIRSIIHRTNKTKATIIM